MMPIASLLRLHAAHDYAAFMRLAVRARKNIVVSGATGSGKTTWTKALIREIPRDERLVTIEDARELVLDRHPNHVRLYYSKDDQGLARVTPKQLLECCLRMRPDRILLAELRAEEAFDYLRNVNSGHPGSITSVHASSAELAFEQLMLLVKQSSRRLADWRARDIKSLLLPADRRGHPVSGSRHRRVISEIWFDPARRLRADSGNGAARRCSHDCRGMRCCTAVAGCSVLLRGPGPDAGRPRALARTAGAAAGRPRSPRYR